MRVLLVGSGGREHAMAAAIARSPLLEALFIAPGNPGTAALGTNCAIRADDVAGLIKLARDERIDLVVPGPEAPLVAGLADACAQAGIACAGPSRAAAELEGSKTFTKEICDAAAIPTARWARFDTAADALAHVRATGAPIVVKADGLAAGKGVIVAQNVEEAETAIKDLMTDATMGDAGRTVVIEECLVGDEVSLFAFCAGEQAVLIGAAQDHKRIGDGDTGPNTGGMGAVSPPAGFDRARQEAALDTMVRPMLREMARRGTPFHGIIFAGLMLTPQGEKLIEYNVRLGDPEAQALLIRLQSDLLAALAAVAKGDLAGTDIRFSGQASISVVMAARGYPGRPVTGGVIAGIDDAQDLPGVQVFQAGTKLDADHHLVAAGGRVLAVCATGDTLAQARTRAYAGVGAIRWDDAIWRHDIGMRALEHTARD
ncbi:MULTISPECIES: phosphoribosylamine--glycine ligase [Novacetimonas]|uniref:Phosphoribosylamine--glycine ligase n=2 Tax=Novacetimonas hansenii TaxID=436 RepID=A0ABQ0SAV7_NOVHA|nr:phosphoribosylamine--glycine ligase [Novacetimonas hansenii]EFG85570.1 phosphoribosylamine--glycine ligase [Novacetimonas hansenii ATCC 23769]GAN83490.1 phosphoribosylamine--glycine ligase [Novacetimonas hansenii JCM 7643]GBQ57234.1 phosphoribosylamine--glycine ligase [Novacetimonas hansenii NRIC 0243]GEC62325.1 phosphoribosylamine--glycine ligase [Novacetimonas hansenii]